jgi:hypothetical protein
LIALGLPFGFGLLVVVSRLAWSASSSTINNARDFAFAFLKESTRLFNIEPFFEQTIAKGLAFICFANRDGSIQSFLPSTVRPPSAATIRSFVWPYSKSLSLVRTTMNSHAHGLGTLDARDSGREFRRQQTVVRCLDGQFPHGCDADVDGHRTETACFEGDTPGAHCGLGQAGPRLQDQGL